MVNFLTHKREIAKRANQVLQEQTSIKTEAFYFSQSSNTVSLVSDAYRSNIPFLLFVNCGGPHLFDLHVILPANSAAGLF